MARVQTDEMSTSASDSAEREREEYSDGEIVLVYETPSFDPDPVSVHGPLVVSGYALATSGSIDVEVEVAGRGSWVAPRCRRPDARLRFSDLGDRRPEMEPGFRLTLPTDEWAPGLIEVTVTARDRAGHERRLTRQVRWGPLVGQVLDDLHSVGAAMWWSTPAALDPPCGDFVFVGGWVAAEGTVSRVMVEFDGRERLPAAVRPAGPDIVSLLAPRRPAGDVVVYRALLDLRTARPGPHQLTIAAYTDADRVVRRGGTITVDPGERYRRWSRERPAPAARAPGRAKAAQDVALTVCVDWRDASSSAAAVLPSLEGQDHPNWSVRTIGAVPALIEDDQGWQRLRAGGRVREHAGDLGDALAALAAGGDARAVVLVRATDRLRRDALSLMASEIGGPPGADVVYADDDCLADGQITAPRLKPGWSPARALSHDYVGPLLAISATGARAALNASRELANSYAFLLAILDADLQVARIPEVLCTRSDDRASGGDLVAGALADFARRQGREVVLEPIDAQPGLRRVRWPLPGRPTVTVVIPTTGAREVLEPCLRSLRDCTAYAAFDVVLVDSGGGEAQTVAAEILDRAEWRVVSYEPDDARFNFARACNLGARSSAADDVLFLNDDVEALDPSWLERLVEGVHSPGVGVVGPRLLLPSGLVQSCGLDLRRLDVKGAGVSDLFAGLEGDSTGPFDVLVSPHERAAVTGACLLIRRSVLTDVGGWDERFPLDLNDADLCLRVWEAGLRVLVVPTAALVHRESATRVHMPSREAARRFQLRWASRYPDGDPWSHPGFSGGNEPVLPLPNDGF